MSGVRWGRGVARTKSGSDSDELSDADSQVDETPTKKSALAYLKNKSQEFGRRGSGQNVSGQVGGGKPPRIRNPLRKNNSNSHSVASSSSDGERSWDDESRDGGIVVPKKKRGGKKKNNSSRASTDDMDASNHSQTNNSQNVSGRGGLFRGLKARSGGGGSKRGGGGGSDRSGDDDSYIREHKAANVRSQSGPINSIMKSKLPGFLRRTQSENYDDSCHSPTGKPPRGGLRSKRSQSDGTAASAGNKGVSFNCDGSVQGGGGAISGDDSEIPATPTGGRTRNVERARYSVYHGQGPRAVKKKFRVRPYRAFQEATYMTEEEIYADSLLQSKRTEFVKSYLVPSTRITRNMDIPDQIRTLWGTPNEDGRIGSFRIEVLGCVSLNRQKPDVCTYVVCGDAAFCTDTIQGYRSPMWPAACKRAAVFPVHHAYAKVCVGVFDVRKRTNKDHDVFCGRVVIDIANIRPDTEYDATMPLRASTFVYDKRKRGVIRIRFSLHWFSERGAVLSYLRSVQTVDDKNPLVSGQPTIPCADPRTFRNVAFTVHGQDLPGKYSKGAFRATIRELNLYQVNLRQMLKVVVLDVMFYENKVVSFYMFLSSMYCVYRNSVALVPATCVGYVLLQYLNNYRHYVVKSEFNFGYKALSITELAKSLLQLRRNIGTDQNNVCFKPIEVEKWTKQRNEGANKYKNITDNSDDNPLNEDRKVIRPLDHREFPFSQRDAYPNFGVEDGLAPGSTKGDTGRLHGRLSVYYAAKDADDLAAGAGANDEDESEEDSDRDDETVLTESQMMGDDGFDMDSASDEDADSHLQGADANYKRVALAERQAKDKTRLIQRVHLGPPQDADTKGKKVPPQVTLKKMENLMYKFSQKVSVEFVHSGPQDDGDDALAMLDTGMTPPPKELRSKIAQKAKKAQADEYDKILGLTVSYANPIQRIMSSFMGPVMRMMRVPIYIARILFHLSTWRDPILSFWVLVILLALFILLIIFPWRSFFFLTSFATMGPQNMFLRKILEKRAKEKDKDKNKENKKPELDESERSVSSTGSSQSSKKGLLQKTLGRKGGKKSAFFKEMYASLDPKSRVPFSTTGQASSSKKLPTRSVAVPYSQLKKDRFFDWPPDPTTARATPVPIFDGLDDDSMTLSGPEVQMEESDDDDEEENDHGKPSTGLRQRKPNADKGTKTFVPPQDIAF